MTKIFKYVYAMVLCIFLLLKWTLIIKHFSSVLKFYFYSEHNLLYHFNNILKFSFFSHYIC
jgi:hypothetical protein